MDPLNPADISFTFSAISTPSMRPGSTWLSYWILGVVCCEGLGQFLWVGTGPPAALPAFVAGIPRPLVVGGALGLFQSLVLARWLKGGSDWWLPTSIGVIVGNFLASHLHPNWPIAAWLPGAAATGFIMAVGQWLVMRRSLRRSAGWIVLCPCAKMAGAMIASWGVFLAAHASASPATKLLMVRGGALIGLALTDGWLLGAALRGMLGPGNYRGPKLRFPS